MLLAVEKDDTAIAAKQPGIAKIILLPSVLAQLSKPYLYDYVLENGLLTAIRVMQLRE